MTLTGHLPMLGQNLIVGSSDVIGYPASNPNHTFLLEAEHNRFYRISSSNNNNPVHPFLKDIQDSIGLIFFIQYDELGAPLVSNHINGTSYPTKAFSFEGGLQMLGSAYNDIEASGQVIPIRDASYLEFLASYDRNCNLKIIRSIWNLPKSVYPNSDAVQDPSNGSFYVYGTTSQNFLEVEGFGPVGEEWAGSFLYLLKFNNDLQVEWAYTAGYNTDTIAGYFPGGDLRVTPGVNGNLLLTGTYYSNGSKPQFGSDALPAVDNGQGVFAVGLDEVGNQTWIKAGENHNWENNARIEKGFSLSNGDFLLTGATSSGYFKLGEAEFIFDGGQDFQNQFVFRVGPDGSLQWLKPLPAMGKSATKKKSTQSEEFNQDIYADAILWNEDVLYMAGTYQNPSFVVADKPLPVIHKEQFFIASINPEDGHENWGYGFSSDFIQLHGFDVDRTGQVSIMGSSSEKQDYNGNIQLTGPAARLIFHVGLDYRGRLLWYNNAFLQNQNFQVSGSDLEVLPNGATFASIQVSASENLDIGDQSLQADFPYTNWLVGLKATMNLSGEVKDESGSPIYPGYVRAYRSAPSRAYPVIDSVLLNDAGSYHFDKLYPGNYTLQVVPNRDMYPDLIPYYLGNHPVWTSAQFNDFGPAFNSTLLHFSIPAVPEFTPEDGSGSISGNVSFKGNLKSTMGRPVKKASVMLLKKGKKSTSASGDVLGYFETDDLGNYLFENVPNGDYILIVDITGLPMVQVYEVTIEDNKIVSGLDYEVGTDGIDMTGYVGVEALKNDGFLIFPNPGDGKILINSKSIGEYEVRVYGTDGRLILAPVRMVMPGQTTLDISQEDQGIYLIVLNGPEASVSVKYIKR